MLQPFITLNNRSLQLFLGLAISLLCFDPSSAKYSGAPPNVTDHVLLPTGGATSTSTFTSNPSKSTKSTSTNPPHTILYTSISLSVPSTQHKILHPTSGQINPGRMTAIMGPSGSGKTSFLNALAGRVDEGEGKKAVKVGGRRYVIEGGEGGGAVEVDGGDKLRAAYVKQEDNMFPQMTVLETLTLRAGLKYGSVLGKNGRIDVVNGVLEGMDLVKCKDGKVGDAKVRGVSGGERKRLSVGMQIMDGENIIMLDEPTSGLDSFQAERVVKVLKRLAVEEGRTVVVVIHQPSMKVLNMFDDLILMSEGMTVYQGPVREFESFAKSVLGGKEGKRGEGESLGEWMLQLVSVDKEFKEECEERINKLAEATKAKSTSRTKRALSSVSVVKPTSRSTSSLRPKVNVFTQIRLLAKRSWNEVFRARPALIIQAVTQLATAGIYGVLYKLKDNGAGVFDRFGLLSLVTIGTLNLGMASSIRSFPKEKKIIKEEREQGLFGVGPYFIAKAVSEIPVTSALSCLFGAVVYPLCGLSNAPGKFRNFLGLVTLHSITSKSLGLLVSALSPSAETALALFAPLTILQIIFDGKNLSYENTPRYLKFMQNLSLVRVAWQGLCINEFKGLEFKSTRGKGGAVIKTGEDALASFDITGTIKDVMVKQVKILVGCWTGAIFGLWKEKDGYANMEGEELEEGEEGRGEREEKGE